MALDESQLHSVRRLALERAGHTRQQTEFRRAPQGFCGGDALASETNAAVGLSAAFEADLAAIGARAGADHGKPLAIEIYLPVRRREQGAVGGDVQVVAGQHQLALDRAGLDFAQRNGQAQLQLGRAGGGAARQRLADPAADRRGVDQAQHFCQRPLCVALQGQHRVVGQVRDAAPHLAPLEAAEFGPGIANFKRGAVQHQVAADAGQCRPRRLDRGQPGRGRRTGHVRKNQILGLRIDAQLALAGRVAKRKIEQIALDAESDRAERACLDRPLHVAPARLRNAQRQVAGGARGHRFGELAVELDLARKAPASRCARAAAGAPAGAEFPLRVAVGKSCVPDLDRDVRRVDLPLQLGGQSVQRQQRVFEHPRQLDRAADQVQLGRATVLVRAECRAGIAQARAAHGIGFGGCARGQRQTAERSLDLVAHRCVERAVPLQAHVAQYALRFQLGQQPAQRIAQRQAGRHTRHQAEIQPLRAEVAAGRGLAGALAERHAQVAAAPAQAVAGEEPEALQRQRQALLGALTGDPPFKLLERQRRHVGSQPQRHRAQRHVDRGAARLAIAHLEPATQRPDAFAQLEGQRHVAAQFAQIRPRQLGVDAAAPAFPVTRPRQQRAGEAATQRETVAPIGRRGRVEPYLVRAQAIAQDQLHVGKL